MFEPQDSSAFDHLAFYVTFMCHVNSVRTSDGTVLWTRDELRIVGNLGGAQGYVCPSESLALLITHCANQ